MKRKIFCVLVATFILCLSLSLAVCAVSTGDILYFYGNSVPLGNGTINGDYVSIALGSYVEDSFSMPFMGYAGNSLGITQKYTYGSVSDLIIDYSDYQSGTFEFTIDFYDYENLICSYDIRTQVDDNDTANVTDDKHVIALFSGSDNLDVDWQVITPNSHPYIAFNLGSILVKAYREGTSPTHFQITFVQSDCTADFRLYGVLNTEETYGDIWQKGFDKGNSVGITNGYNNGYDEGYSDGVESGKDSVDVDFYYNDGYQDGYNEGVELNDAYNVGFEEGKKWRNNNTGSVNAFSDFFKSIMGSIVSFFLYVGTNMEFMGTPILGILAVIVVGVVAVLLAKLVINK